MNGNEIPTNPAIAMGNLSASLILSVLVEKNSSGSESRVNDARSGSPMSMFNVVVVLVGVVVVARRVILLLCEGVKDVAIARMAHRSRSDLSMVVVCCFECSA